MVNYIRKRTWAEIMEGEPAPEPADPPPAPKPKQAARNNGGGAKK